MNKTFTILLGFTVIAIMGTYLLQDAASTAQKNPEAIELKAWILATIAAALLASTIGQGICPNNVRTRNILTPLMLIASYKTITILIIGGTKSFLFALTMPMTKEAAENIPSAVTEGSKIVTAIKQLCQFEQIQFEGKIELAYVVLLTALLACIYKLSRSFGWTFIITILIAITGAIATHHFRPRMTTEVYVIVASVTIGIPLLIAAAFTIKYWHSPQTT